MAKKPVKKDAAQRISSKRFVLSPVSKKIMAAGACLAATGFFLLAWTDPMGRNWASTLSPCCILLGYAIMAWGVFSSAGGGDVKDHETPP